MSVRRTEAASFELVDRQTNYVWLKLLESRDAGMRFAIRIDHKKHDDGVRRTLEHATVGERFVLVLADDPETESGNYVSDIRRSTTEVPKESTRAD